MRRLAGAGLIGVAGAAAAAVVGWARAKGLAVSLGPAGLGVYGQLWAFVLYAGAFGALGIGVGTTSMIAANAEEGDKVGLSEIAALSLAIPAGAGTLVFVVTAATSVALAPLLIASHDWPLLVIAAGSIPLAAVQVPLQHVIQGFEDVIGQTVAYVLYSAGFSAISVVGAFAFGVKGAVIALGLGNLLLAGLYLARTRVLLVRAGAEFRLMPHVRRGVGSVGSLVKVGSASLTITVAFAAADLAVRTSLLHATNRGVVGLWFGLLLISLQFIGGLVGAMSYFTAPMAARAVARADHPAIRTVLDDSLRLALIVILPILAAIVALRRPVISVLFSADFAPMARYIPYMMAADAMRIVAWTLGVALVPLGLTRAWLATTFGASAAFAVVGVVGTQVWGLGGAVGAWSVLWFVSAVATATVLIVRRLWRPSRHSVVALLYGPVALGAASVWPGAFGLGVAVLLFIPLAAVAVRASERTAVLAHVRARAFTWSRA